MRANLREQFTMSRISGEPKRGVYVTILDADGDKCTILTIPYDDSITGSGNPEMMVTRYMEIVADEIRKSGPVVNALTDTVEYNLDEMLESNIEKMFLLYLGDLEAVVLREYNLYRLGSK